MEKLIKVLRDLFTEDDNESADLIPIVALLAALVYLGLWIYIVVSGKQAFNGIEFGTGWAAMLTAWGLAFKLKRDAQTKPLAGETPAQG
jgi:uncharacterized membrane protein (DUF373 family)